MGDNAPGWSRKAKENNRVISAFDPKLEGFRFSVAPMMDWTDRHCRAFHRVLSARARLYTEMVTADAVIHGPRERLLGFDAAERPLALQLGGAEPANWPKPRGSAPISAMTRST